MPESYTSNSNKDDGVARTLAIVGIIFALLALGWAIKADSRTDDTDSTVESSQQTQGVLPADSNDASMQSTDQENTEDSTEATTAPDTTNPDAEEQP